MIVPKWVYLINDRVHWLCAKITVRVKIVFNTQYITFSQSNTNSPASRTNSGSVALKGSSAACTSIFASNHGSWTPNVAKSRSWKKCLTLVLATRKNNVKKAPNLAQCSPNPTPSQHSSQSGSRAPNLTLAKLKLEWRPSWNSQEVQYFLISLWMMTFQHINAAFGVLTR